MRSALAPVTITAALAGMIAVAELHPSEIVFDGAFFGIFAVAVLIIVLARRGNGSN